MVHLLKINKENKIFKEKGCWRYIYQNKLDNAFFQHDMAYGDFKDLNRRTASDKVLCNSAFNYAKDPKHDGYQILDLLQWSINVLIKNF